MFGSDKEKEKFKPCRNCGGTGTIGYGPGDSEYDDHGRRNGPCPKCKGSGER